MDDMWYAVELNHGLRPSEGVRDMGSQWAMEVFAEKNRIESKERWNDLGISDCNGWTTVVVNEEGLKNLPMRKEGK